MLGPLDRHDQRNILGKGVERAFSPRTDARHQVELAPRRVGADLGVLAQVALDHGPYTRMLEQFGRAPQIGIVVAAESEGRRRQPVADQVRADWIVHVAGIRSPPTGIGEVTCTPNDRREAEIVTQ